MQPTRPSTIAAALTCTAALFVLAFGGDYTIDRFTVDGGGGSSSGGALALSGTIGQPDAGIMTGDDYILIGGYWADLEPPCPTDTNGDNVTDVDDLINVILDWGTDGSMHGGDVDGSGIVDVDDLVGVILASGPCP